MNDFRTHGDCSAVDDDEPLPERPLLADPVQPVATYNPATHALVEKRTKEGWTKRFRRYLFGDRSELARSHADCFAAMMRDLGAVIDPPPADDAVDPDVLAVREIRAQRWDAINWKAVAQETRNGKRDQHSDFQRDLALYRAGKAAAETRRAPAMERQEIARAVADGFSGGNEQYDEATTDQRERYDMAAAAVRAHLTKEPPND